MDIQNNLSLLVLAIVQGATEWLPVSSEGLSMLLMLNVLKINFSEAFSYAVFLHLGTMIAVVVKFRRVVIDILTFDSPLLRHVLLSTIFTAVSALPLMLLLKNFEANFANVLIGFLLIGTGIILRLPKEGYRKAEELSSIESVLLGIAQGFAILPGVSRSGVTVSYLLLRKVREEDALTLSFIISAPVVAGAIVLNGLPGEISVVSASLLTLATFATGYLMIDLLLRLAKKLSFSNFCIFLGAIAVILTLVTL